jgi:hypothetical protein
MLQQLKNNVVPTDYILKQIKGYIFLYNVVDKKTF